MSFLPKLPKVTNAIQSQQFGRRVYQIKQGEQVHWLKLQLRHSHHEYLNGFQHELEIYDQLNRIAVEGQSIIGNFSIIDPFLHFQINESVIENALWIEHTSQLFDQAPIELDFLEIIARLISSLDVLECMHELGFVHGDLKKQHFRNQLNRTILIDFEQTYRLDRIFKGLPNNATPRYMAPELFHSENKSFQTDIYALGIIWLEWLTEQKLSAKNYQDWAVLHCQQLKIVLPVQYMALEETLHSMLSKNKGQRCTNIYQIKQQLSQIA